MFFKWASNNYERKLVLFRVFESLLNYFWDFVTWPRDCRSHNPHTSCLLLYTLKFKMLLLEQHHFLALAHSYFTVMNLRYHLTSFLSHCTAVFIYSSGSEWSEWTNASLVWKIRIHFYNFHKKLCAFLIETITAVVWEPQPCSGCIPDSWRMLGNADIIFPFVFSISHVSLEKQTKNKQKNHNPLKSVKHRFTSIISFKFMQGVVSCLTSFFVQMSDPVPASGPSMERK